MSFIYLEIDTISPVINIKAPRYTTVDIVNEISIESNEALDDYQEIYVIDSNGVKHDYVFQKESDYEYVGMIKFADFPIGIVTLYARLKDGVGNLSNMVYSSIEIKETLNTMLYLEINDYIQNNISINDYQNIAVSNNDSLYINVQIDDELSFDI